MDHCVALFERGPEGTRLIDRSYDPELIQLVAECFAARKRVEIEELEGATALRPPAQADAGGEG